MRFLFVGDVYGRPGREAVLGLVPLLRQRHRLDAVVVNAENAARGRGISPKIADEMFAGGVDVLTGGNHSWQIQEIRPYIEAQGRLIRPANHQNVPGKGSYVCALADGRRLGVVQVEGQVFMRQHACPFDTLDKELAALGPTDAIVVDVHAEATSEKQAIAHYLNGRVSAVIGTHTHVQTADERILSRGTALLTDAGMTGPYNSIIGMASDVALARFLKRGRPERQVAEGDVRLCGAIVETDDATGKARSIERLQALWPEPPTGSAAQAPT
jgi:metallophosphoesterase (TIGR00282 family)